MPGGHLSHGIYQRLGGERDFTSFWLHLGLPTLAVIATCYYFLVVSKIISLKAWSIGSVFLVTVMAACVSVRVLH